MKKGIAAVLAMLLCMGAAAAGTLAYLTDGTETLKNTFTLGRVAVELFETDEDGEQTWGRSYPLIPGTSWKKDPVVQVPEGSEDCWLFVKFEEPAPKPDWLVYTSTLTAANRWTRGDGRAIPADVWYRTVLKTDELRRWELLADNTIRFPGDKLTEDNMPAENAAPMLRYTAYACQKRNGDTTFTAPQAWEKLAGG